MWSLAILIGRGLDLKGREEEWMFAGQLSSCAVLKVRGRRKRLMRRGSEGKREKVSGDNGWREPPVPIPNTEVKPPHADGTRLGTAWESRTLPGSKKWSGGNGSFSRSCPMRGEEESGEEEGSGREGERANREPQPGRKGSGSEGARTAKAGSAGQREGAEGPQEQEKADGEEKKQESRKE